MAVSILAQLLVSALLSTSAEAQAAGGAAAAPAPACGSPIYDPKHDCRVLESGSAIIQCTILPDGTLQSCSVVSEDPPGKGFGEAALHKALTAKYTADSSRPATGALGKIKFSFKAGD